MLFFRFQNLLVCIVFTLSNKIVENSIRKIIGEILFGKTKLKIEKQIERFEIGLGLLCRNTLWHILGHLLCVGLRNITAGWRNS